MVAAQLVELSLSTPEIHCSNPNMAAKLHLFLHLSRKDKNKDKDKELPERTIFKKGTMASCSPDSIHKNSLGSGQNLQKIQLISAKIPLPGLNIKSLLRGMKPLFINWQAQMNNLS